MFTNIKSWPIFLFFIGYIFIVSGLIVNFLMLCSCILWPINKRLYRMINRYLSYSHWANFTFWGQWWSKSEVVMKVPEGTKHQLFGKEHAIVILNHKYDIDWLMGWLLAERMNAIGGSKIYGKQMLKYVPLLGWAWYFTESIFLKRNWEKDRKSMLASLNDIPDFPYPVWLLLCCEGTRFTDEKHAKGVEFAKKVGLPPLKHHLMPRTKGFVHSMYALKGRVPAIYSTTIAFRTDGAVPTLKSIYNGFVCRCEMHIERIEITDVPTDSDDVCADWLHKLYQRKDELFDTFEREGSFPGEVVDVPRRLNDLVMWLFWALVTCIPLFYYVTSTLVRATLHTQLIVLAITIALALVLNWMINVASVDRGEEYNNRFNKKQQ